MRQAKKTAATILAAVITLGSFGVCSAGRIETAFAGIADDKAVAQTIAEEGAVLLKNDGALPLRSSDQIAAYRMSDQVYGGSGSGLVVTQLKKSYSAALSEAREAKKISAVYFDRLRGNKALYLLSRSATEGGDGLANEGGFYLSATEKNEISELIEVMGAENVVVILNVGSVIDTSWLIEQDVGSILLAYYGGSMSGDALVNILTGEVNPSGKTVDTWAKSYLDYPSASVGEFGLYNKVDYTEDVFVGYRYFSTFDPDYEKVNYEFGYGLSYTDFEIKNKTAQVKDGAVTVSATVKNKGEVAGKEVVQVYYSSPQSVQYGGESVYFGNPARELGGYVKTDLLEPGAEQTVSVSFPLSDMATYDDAGKISLNSYLMLEGEYEFYAGNSVKNATLVSKYTQEKTAVGETLSKMEDSLLPERLLADGSRETLYRQNVASYGATMLQGELFDAKNTAIDTNSGDVFAKDVSGAKSFRYVGNLQGHKGDWVEYGIFADKAGEYSLGYSVAREGAFTYTNPGDVYLDGKKIASGFSYTGTGSWTAFRYFTSDTVLALSEGKHTLRFVNASGELPNIDFITLYNNKVAPDGQTVIEAENYDGSTGGMSGGDLATTDPAKESGKTFSYTLDVEKAGKYDLTVFYSNLRKASAAGLEISVGTNAQTVGLKRTARSTDALDSNYFMFAESDSVMVELPAGEVTITLTTKDDALACLDKLVLTPFNGTPRVKDAYEDNTAEYETVLSETGASLISPMSFGDLKEKPQKLDTFLSQLSIRELAVLSQVGVPNKTPLSFDIGSFGGLTLGALAGGNRFNIPQCFVADAGAGIRMPEYQGSEVVWFPSSTMLASSWNDALAEEFGKAIGRQYITFGADMWLAPSVNIHRNPLCGRNFEYYSEDPLVSGKIGAAAVRGAQSMGISVCVKHFAANNQETARFTSVSCVSNRALREIYLNPFEIIVKESEPLAIMSSYNMINGEYAGATESLLNDILRGEWGFDGVVLSDWICHVNHLELLFGGTNIKSIVHDDENQKQTGGYAFIRKAYLSGYVTREQLEDNARDILKLLLRLDGAEYPYGSELYVDAAVRDEKGTDISAKVNFTKEERDGVCKFRWNSEEYKIVSVCIDGSDNISLSEGSNEYTLRDVSKETEIVFFAEKIETGGMDVPNPPETDDSGNPMVWIAVSVSAAIVLFAGAAITCVMIVRKRKKH